MYKAFEIFAYTTEDGAIILKPKVVTSLTEQGARDNAVLRLGQKGYSPDDVEAIKVVVRPLD